MEKNTNEGHTKLQSASLDILFENTWFAEAFNEEIGDVDPAEPVHPRDEIVGTMTSLEKRIYALRAKFSAMSKTVEGQLQMRRGDETLLAAMADFQERAHVMDQILWSLLHERFETSPNEGLGIRTDFKVVRTPAGGSGLPGIDVIKL